MTLAQDHLSNLGVPIGFEEGSYEKEDAIRLLQGHPIDPVTADAIHSRMAASAGTQLISLLEDAVPGGRWQDRLLVRTLPFGESSASFLSFEDDSYAILVSRALQESLIRMANVLVYFDLATSLARLSLRRKKKERRNLEATTRITALLRCLVLGQRMTGRAPEALAVLDRESFQYAGELAISGVMFVIAHELAHIVLQHVDSSMESFRGDPKISISKIQELQADDWALNCLTELLGDGAGRWGRKGMTSHEIALWAAFLGLIATQVTEQAVYVRRNRTHPEAWVRWAVLEEKDEDADKRTNALRLSFLFATVGATKLDESFPSEAWSSLWRDRELTVAGDLTSATLQSWDYLQTCPLDELLDQAKRSATSKGMTFLEDVAECDLSLALSRIGVSNRRAERLLDPSSALDFSSLRKAIEDADSLAERDEGIFTIAATRLAVSRLEERSA